MVWSGRVQRVVLGAIRTLFLFPVYKLQLYVEFMHGVGEFMLENLAIVAVNRELARL